MIELTAKGTREDGFDVIFALGICCYFPLGGFGFPWFWLPPGG
jgi:hypothetical protein